MPELPDVEAMRRYLVASGVAEARVTRVDIGWPKAIQGTTAEEFAQRLTGRTILDVARRAKYLFFPLDVDVLVVHLRMTGFLEVVRPHTPLSSQPSATFGLSTGEEIRFYDPRRLGKLWLVEDTASLFDRLGPEPLEPSFTVAVLADRLKGRRAPIKPVLLEQEVIAGIGNIYADEILFCAGVHPTHSATELTPQELGRLYACIVSVLSRAMEALSPMIPLGGPPTESQQGPTLLYVPRQPDVPCTTCGTPVRRLVLRGRSAYFCSTCQGNE